MLNKQDMQKAITWAYLTAKQWGWSTSKDDGYIWVNTGSKEIGCRSDYDFVSFMADAVNARCKR